MRAKFTFCKGDMWRIQDELLFQSSGQRKQMNSGMIHMYVDVAAFCFPEETYFSTIDFLPF